MIAAIIAFWFLYRLHAKKKSIYIQLRYPTISRWSEWRLQAKGIWKRTELFDLFLSDLQLQQINHQDFSSMLKRMRRRATSENRETLRSLHLLHQRPKTGKKRNRGIGMMWLCAFCSSDQIVAFARNQQKMWSNAFISWLFGPPLMPPAKHWFLHNQLGAAGNLARFKMHAKFRHHRPTCCSFYWNKWVGVTYRK